MAFFSLDFSLHPCEGYIHIYHTADNRLQAVDSPISSSFLFTLPSIGLQTNSRLGTMAVSSLFITFWYMCQGTQRDSILALNNSWLPPSKGERVGNRRYATPAMPFYTTLARISGPKKRSSLPRNNPARDVRQYNTNPLMNTQII